MVGRHSRAPATIPGLATPERCDSISIGGRIAHSGRVTGGGERSLRSDGRCGRRGQEEIGADTRFMGLSLRLGRSPTPSARIFLTTAFPDSYRRISGGRRGRRSLRLDSNLWGVTGRDHPTRAGEGGGLDWARRGAGAGAGGGAPVAAAAAVS